MTWRGDRVVNRYKNEEEVLRYLFRCLILIPGIMLAMPVPALAQSYPTGPVRVIVPFPPGGGVDGAGRLISQKLSEALGKQFVVDNRPGANGMIGRASCRETVY